MKRIALTGAFVLGSLVSLNLLIAQEESPEEQAAAAVVQRQAVFQLLAFSNAPLANMARGAAFDADAALQGTERVAMLAKMIPEVLATDTTAVSGLTTRASDIIWANQAEIAALAADLEAGANEALEILRTQGQGGVRLALTKIGPKCGACHDRFRLE